MASHRRLQVLVAAHAALLAATTNAGSACYIGRLSKITDDESLVITHGGDDPREAPEATVAFLDSDLELFVDISVHARDDVEKGTTVPYWLEKISALHAQVHVALMADPTLGLSWLHELEPEGADRPNTESQGERVRVTLRTRWRAIYRSSYADPTQ